MALVVEAEAFLALDITTIVPLASLAQLPTGFDKIIFKLNAIIDTIRSLNCAILSVHLQKTLNTAMALSALVASGICCQCIIKNGFFHNTTHLCIKTLPNNACQYYTLSHVYCKPVCNLS